MPHLTSDSGAVRLALDLVQREGGPPPVRVLATAAVEWLDSRDGEWWPFVRLPPLHVDEIATDEIVAGIRDLLSGAAPGFSWQGGSAAALGIQLGATEGGVVVEVGLDLGAFLADASGLPARAGGEAALFRFVVASAELVRFGAAIEAQLEGLRGSPG